MHVTRASYLMFTEPARLKYVIPSRNRTRRHTKNAFWTEEAVLSGGQKVYTSLRSAQNKLLASLSRVLRSSLLKCCSRQSFARDLYICIKHTCMKPTEVFFSRFLSVDCNKFLKEKLALLILDFGRQTQFDLFGA